MKSLSHRLKSYLIAAIVIVVLAMPFAVGLVGIAPTARAATQNIATAIPGVVTMPFHISGTRTDTSTAGAIKFAMPFKVRLLGVGAVARTASGTMTFDLVDDGVSVLSSAITASTNYVEGTLANPVVLDESLMAVNISGSGGPSFADITLFITGIRE